MAPVEEKHLAELVKSGHKVGNGFHNGGCRIGILHQKLQYRRIEDLLYTCIGCFLNGFHVLGILLSFVLQVLFSDLRRLFRDLGHAYVGRLPIEGLVINIPVSSILMKIEGSGEQLTGRTQTSHLEHSFGILRTNTIVLDQVHGSIFFHESVRRLGSRAGERNLLSVRSHLNFNGILIQIAFDGTAKISGTYESVLVAEACIALDDTCALGNFKHLVVTDMSSQALVLRFLDNKIIRIKAALAVFLEASLYIEHGACRHYKDDIKAQVGGS